MAVTGEEGTLPESAVDALRAQLRGPVFVAGDDGYDDARAVYNAMIDRRPAVIARCVDTADVMAAVQLARETGVLTAVRGGGHNGGGLGTCEGGLVIDLSGMRGIRVDPDERTVRVEGGATWGDVDHATHAFGMATPSGILGTTGVGGLTLGGGSGNLTRKYGLTIDNLLGVDMVLADGTFVQANERENADLFWAVRGGGGNFGVVTSFQFQLHPVSTVVAGPTLWAMERSAEVLGWYQDFIRKAPEELTGWFVYLTVPPVAPFPEHLHLKKMCGVVWCYCGAEADADEVFRPIREFGPPDLYGVHALPFPGIQSAFDALYPKGQQWYWRADFFDEFSADAIQVHAKYGAALPTPSSAMHVYPVDGAVHRVGKNDTPFSFRDVNFSAVIVGVDPEPANAEKITSWTKAYWEELHPYSAGGAYVNFMMDEGQDRVRATYGDNYARLVEVKKRYDPDNLFRVNQNIRPAE